MPLLKLTMLAVAIAAVGSSAIADGVLIKPITKSTQAAPVPPVPPGVTALFGPNAGLFLGTVGVPGVVVGVVTIGGLVYTVFIRSSSSTTTT